MTQGNTLSEEFDAAYASLQELLEDQGSYATEKGKSAGVESLQLTFENLTRLVSTVEMFSKNEVYAEMDPKSLKFLLLPYFLGALWQQKRGVERCDIWTVAEVYFRDFLERLLDTEILQTKPHVLTVLQAQSSEGGDGDSAGSAPSKSLPVGNENRQIKIARYKQSKDLEAKIKVLSERQKHGGDDDPATIQELYLNLLRKYALEAEAELESLQAEKELVLAHSDPASSQAPPPKPAPKSSLPFETFIITKSDVQKKTFGKGYPSLPVMTVEELYRDRVAKGIWAKPTTVDDTNRPPEDAESDQAQLEVLEEVDDAARRASQLAVDEYKDMHRRGWGNRMNRS